MRSNHSKPSYEQLFVQFSDQVELWLKRGVLVLIVLLILAQGLLQIPHLHKVLSEVDRLEGEPYPQSIIVK